jgi:hypothetical protein
LLRVIFSLQSPAGIDCTINANPNQKTAAMNQRVPDKVVPFAPAPREPRQNEADPLDRSGQAIVTMLQEAVDVAKQNCERTMDIAHKLSLQLRAAEDRLAQLEGDIRHYQERAARAEKWMHRIHSEIEDRFFKDGAAPNGSARR